MIIFDGGREDFEVGINPVSGKKEDGYEEKD